MKFTPKFNVRPVACGILALGGLGWIAWAAPAPATQEALAVQDSFRSYGASIIPAVEVIPPADVQRSTAEHNNIILAHWYNNKYWWKRHAPIVGGAAGGALIGGLAGGGTGALIGGAAGAGGGYVYKHYRDKHHRGEAYRYNHGEAYRSTQPVPQRPAYEYGR